MTKKQITYALKKYRKNAEGILLYVSSEEEFLSLEFGTGDNLLPEDRDEGYVGYIEIYGYLFDGFEFVESGNGGEYMFDEKDSKKYGLEICNTIYDVLCYIYEIEHGDEVPDIQVLKTF